ncbi:MAG TPA: cell division protein FtsQ [Gallionella sp.]|nr:cell division protein FtsQ [Gallionella sp.]
MMSLLLAGLTVLVIGDSHLARKDYLIDTLHEELRNQGAKVYSYGACGTPSGAWMKAVQPPCGSAFHLDDGKTRIRAGEAGTSVPLPELVAKHHPDLIVVVNGDTMAAYKEPVIPKKWIWDQVTTLTNGIKASGAACVWVGPGWGAEGGKYGKTYARSQQMSDYLADIVAPCTYISTLQMAKPGEWGALPGDGQHYTNDGYRAWGSGIAKQILSSDILQQIKH